MVRSTAFFRFLPPFFLVFGLLSLYLSTLAPGLTWANFGSDGGDLITATATGGVPHPTGYPLYLVLARPFQYLPLGSLAYRTNLMSAICTALAAWLAYQIVVVSCLPNGRNQARLAGLATGAAYGLAPLVWSQAVISEVYALHGLLVLLVLILYTQPEPASPKIQRRLDRTRGLVLGLAMGIHLTTILLLPAAIFLGSVQCREKKEGLHYPNQSWLRICRLNKLGFVRQMAWFGIGLSVFGILPLRALAAPPVNWGNPRTLEGFWWLISGGEYRSYFLLTNLTGAWEQLHTWAATLLRQFGLPGLILGLVGLVLYGRVSRFYLLTVWIAMVFSAFAILYRSEDSFVYLIPMLGSFAIWIGVGTAGLAHEISRRFPRLDWVLGLLAVVYFIGCSLVKYQEVDASRDLRAENFGREVLAVAPKNALIFAQGDQAVFTLWYFHFALGERPDLAVLATDLLHFNWYRENIQANYPSLKLPDTLLYPETISLANPTRAICRVQYSIKEDMDCIEGMPSPQR